MNLKGKRALVMGLGLHDGGLGVTRFLVEQGAHVTVTDLRSTEVLGPTLAKLAGLPVEYVLGEHREADFQKADLVVRNPAVPRESPFLEVARQAGASIEMEMTLFFKLCPSRHILGITGTRGKTSTTVLAGEMLKAWRPDTVVAGNLRVSALEKLGQIGSTTPVVLELSSWQLEGLGEQQLSPPFAAVTNISPDHLNRYRDMADYANAKRNIYRWQDKDGVVVLNADDELVSTFGEDAPGTIVWFSVTGHEPGLGYTEQGRPFTSAYLADGEFRWVELFEGGETPKVESCPAELLKVPGRHNQANALTAIALVNVAGCPKDAIIAGLTNFKGVPDRLELVREVGGVRYYNDTTATSPAGAVAALEAFADDKGQIVLIAGGADKKLDFAPMIEAIKLAAANKRLKRIIMLDGSATNRLITEMRAAKVSPIYTQPYGDLENAVRTAHASADPGDLVLLSPGAASFGMFVHEFERGEQFRQLVNKL